ncbi:hypothetical protein BDD43_3397 [Mucilaginibacter gracilis]|uniref:Major capsid protein E n=1 Tax=Mucilaginibacter gracilis TaxID=423350 RepID=A0A495J2J6_9SPHI|nr:hypothetical protein [Mucilaginibacter gracilis]RKR83195.1 hypothetical protein BDD43_3397 [Mucilaginibacter gracilis]
MNRFFLRKVLRLLVYYTPLITRAFMGAITMLFGVFCAMIVGGVPLIGAAAGLAFFALAYRFRHSMPRAIAMAGVYVEVWTGELVKQFNEWEDGTFLDGISDYSQYADKNVIHLVDVGVNPDVLINNTTYPIAVQNLGDGDITISLDKYQTLATRITDDELYSISYDKIALKREQHGDAIMNDKFNKAIHALAPAGNTANTPVLMTTGADDGTGRKRLTMIDLVNFKTALDKLKVPKKGRRLVLCNDHIGDLLSLDQKFQDQYTNYTEGIISKTKGFDIYEYVNCPYFNISTKAKLAFGSLPVAGTHNEASVFFLPSRMFKATGTTKMYFSEAAISPLTQENLINFRHYFIVLPKKQQCIGAIVSAAA